MYAAYASLQCQSSKIDESVPHEGEVDDVDGGEEQGAEHAEAEDLVPAQR